MNGNIIEATVTTSVRRLTWSYDGEQRIDRKELQILLARGRSTFATAHDREPEFDNDWWLEWGDESIAFCFAEPTREALQ